MSSIQVPQGYSYVLAAATSSIFLNFYQMANTGVHRRAAGIPYPYAYAEKAEAAENKAANKFNCAQRAHQNTLEQSPYVILSILVTGLKYPYVAAGLGATWVIGRLLYTIGYSSGDPIKRMRPGGRISGLSMIGLAASTAYAVFEFVKAEL